MTGMFLNFLSTGVAGSSGGVDGRLPSWSHLSILAHEAGRPRSIREEADAAHEDGKEVNTCEGIYGTGCEFIYYF